MSNDSESKLSKLPDKALYLRLSVSYAIAALLWVLALDWAILEYFGESPHIDYIIKGKNVLFVLLSAFGLWDFSTKYLKRESAIEEKGREAEERLELLGAIDMDAYWLSRFSKKEKRFRLEHASASLVSILGCDFDALKLDSNFFKSRINRSDVDSVLEVVDRFFEGKGGSSLDTEFRVSQVEGNTRWIWVRAKMEFSAKGQPLRIGGIVRDLTERKKTELAIHESERLFKSLFEKSRDAIALCGMDGSFLNVNTAFVELLGYDRKDLQSMTFQSLSLKGWKREENRILKEEVRARGFSDVYEKKCVRKDGDRILVSVRISVFYDANDVPAGMFAIVRDIQKEKDQLNEVLFAKDEAESAHMAQNRLLSVVSQELRTPLNPIIGYSDLLLSQIEDPMQRDFLNIIRNSASIITKLIADILDYSKVESGDIEFDETPFRISELITLAAEEVEIQAKENGNTIQSIYEWRNCAVRGDKDRILQILDNLLSNACKFTRNGQIVLRCGIKKGKQEGSVFRFAVEDSGVGIDEDQLHSIFQPFKKANDWPVSGVGAGLGLAVANQLAVAMGGGITVQSQKGRGSTFSVDLPLPIVAFEEGLSEETSEEFTSLARNGYRVLVVEDNGTNLESTKDLLRSLGCEVSVARNGEESLAVLNQAEYDLVLMDVNMPIMNGCEATNRLRIGNGVNHEVPVVAMTADVSREAFDSCMQSGMNDVLAKPFTISDFEGVLHKWLER